MTHPPPSDRTLEFIRRRRTAGVPPVFNPGLSAGDPATAQKLSEAKSAVADQTNPIPPSQQPTANRQQPKKRNEPNFTRGGPVEDEKM